jgi:hypothetical protein
MEDLHRTRSGIIGEDHNMVTLQDMKDSQCRYDHLKEESYLRRTVILANTI